jgi:hypothetical protein
MLFDAEYKHPIDPSTHISSLNLHTGLWQNLVLVVYDTFVQAVQYGISIT